MWSYVYGASTDRGDVRKENQDSCLCVSGSIGGTPAALFVLADGMGGLSFGAQVSQCITSRFAEWWQEDFSQMVQAGRDSREDLDELLGQEIWDINQEIRRFNNQMQCRAGSTVVVLFMYGSEYFVKSLGDSRIYLARGTEFRQLTEDQSLVAKMVREKKISEEEALRSERKNVLTMCLGMFEIPETHSAAGRLALGDCFLLCSDGLYNCVSRERIAQVLWDRTMDCQEKVACLRQSIPPGTASDNVTVVITEVGEI